MSDDEAFKAMHRGKDAVNELVRRAVAASEEKVEELEATLGDEEAAHADTLRLWQESKARVAMLQQLVDFADRVRCAWIEEHGPSFDLENPVEAALADLEAAMCAMAMQKPTFEIE